MIKATLDRVTLHGSDASCEPVGRFAVLGPLVGTLDVEEVSYAVVGPQCAAVLLGWSMELAPKGGGRALASVSATFRLIYTVAALTDPSGHRDLVAIRGVADAWPYWLDHLTTTLARMGLPPQVLSATPPKGVAPMVRAAFDAELRVAARRSSGAGGGGDVPVVRESLPRGEGSVYDSLGPVLARLQSAQFRADEARRVAQLDGTRAAATKAREASEAVMTVRSSLDAIWRAADPRALGQLIERLVAPVDGPICLVQLVELRDGGAVSRLRAASSRAAYERAIASIAAVAQGRLDTARTEAVGPAGSLAFRGWVTTPDRLAVDVDGEIWNAVPLDDDTVLASKVL